MEASYCWIDPIQTIQTTPPRASLGHTVEATNPASSQRVLMETHKWWPPVQWGAHLCELCEQGRYPSRTLRLIAGVPSRNAPCLHPWDGAGQYQAINDSKYVTEMVNSVVWRQQYKACKRKTWLNAMTGFFQSPCFVTDRHYYVFQRYSGSMSRNTD